MINSSAEFFSRIMQRWLPDAFLFAVILSAIVFFSGMVFQEESAVKMAHYFGNSFWDLLAFSMQMVLILVLGHIVAQSTPIDRLLNQIAIRAKTPRQSIIIVTLVSMIAAWINWGFGLVVGALVAKKIANIVRTVNYPLLVASAYSGFLVWHGGLSGSIPLKIASDSNDALNQLLNGQVIAIDQTILAAENLVILGALLISLPIVNFLMQPQSLIDQSHDTTQTPRIDNEKNQINDQPQSNQSKHLFIKKSGPLTPAEKLETSPIVSMILGIILITYLFQYFVAAQSINLNVINLCLLTAGILLHFTPRNFLNALNRAISSASGIIIQFPIYAGLMGMMVDSGMAERISLWFIEISNQDSFSLLTFLSAGIVNFFVPSGGGQWAVQAPIVIPAAQNLGVPLNHAAMSVAWGDAWTNMIQPFWALPLLGIAGLSIRQIMGYCTVIFLWSGLLIGSLIYFLY